MELEWRRPKDGKSLPRMLLNKETHTQMMNKREKKEKVIILCEDWRMDYY